MESTSYAGLPVPEPHEADLVDYWIGQLAEKLDTTTVLPATSAADRDARYTAAPAGILVVSNPAGTVNTLWVKTGAAGVAQWDTVWEAAPTGQVWFPPASISAGWTDLHSMNPFVAPFTFQYDKKTDTVLMRGALYRTGAWVISEVIAFVPTNMIPVYACGYLGNAYASDAACAGGEIRQTTGEIRLWTWALRPSAVDAPADAAIWFDGTSYRKGAL